MESPKPIPAIFIVKLLTQTLPISSPLVQVKQSHHKRSYCDLTKLYKSLVCNNGALKHRVTRDMQIPLNIKLKPKAKCQLNIQTSLSTPH